MPKNNLKLVAMLMMMLSVNMTPAVASPKTCDEVLSLCDQAVQDLRQVVNKQDILIKDQNDLVLTQRTKIDQLNSENKSIFRSPYLWFGLGFVGGVVLMKK